MAFRPPSLRTSRPRSPVNRSTPWGKEVLVLFGLVIGMAVVLLSIHTSLINTTLRLIIGFSKEAEPVDQGVGLGRYPGVCAHNGIDESLTPHQEEVLQSLNIVSLADRLTLMCQLGISDLSVPVGSGFAEELRNIYPTRICCADYDVFFSAEGTAFVGRPSLIAMHIVLHRQKNGIVTVDHNTNQTVGGSDLGAIARQIEHDLLRNAIRENDITSADSKRKFAQPLKDIAQVLGRVLSTQSGHLALHGVNSTRITLEPKVTNAAPPARTPLERGELISYKQERAALSASADLATHHALYIGDALQLIAQELGKVSAKMQLLDKVSLHEYFGIIIDPLRYSSVWDRLMLSTPASRVVGSHGVDGPAGLTVLATEPQLWYVISVKDIVLVALASNSHVVAAAEGGGDTIALPDGLDAEQYCSWLLKPPKWAREVAPSLKLQKKCSKWYDVEVQANKRGGSSNSTSTSNVQLHKRARSLRKPVSGGESWYRAARRVTQKPPLLSWVVDTVDEYDRIVSLGDRDGLRSSFVISNRAQMLHAEVAVRFPHTSP
ncbi:membrane-associated protein, putative [Bodo saltans]|uniref:Membrane-associated protein, putative n=1 Tax=Bodo saltans TaxID=75058 RepID=A0A0S4JAZ1_BODSA|nr:membrane-associated protein, putative [Bodo saltans]|eukprot:CUG87113.1 membrane-associated protein, putative [Bodo saltans]